MNKPTKRSFPSKTKNLVLLSKKLFKKVANSLPSFPALLMTKIKRTTNILVLKEFLEVPEFQREMIRLYESNELLKMLIQGRMQWRNLSNFLFYFNRFVNGIYDPSLMIEGLWTCQVISEKVAAPSQQ